MLSAVYVIKRTINAFVAFVVANILIFFLPRLMPGSPEDMFASAYKLPPEAAEQLRVLFGLDKPIDAQLMAYLSNVVFKYPPEFGISYAYYPAKVWTVISRMMPWTIFLVGQACILTAICGIMLGILAGWKRGSKVETGLSAIATFLLATPYFWVAMLLLLFFGVLIPLFPMTQAVSPDVSHLPQLSLPYIASAYRHASLPIISLVLCYFAPYMIVMKHNMTTVLGEDYVLLAEAKGIRNRDVILRHVARNAILPVVTIFTIRIGTIVAGTIMTETVFSYPGIGLLTFNAILAHDYPVLQGVFFIMSVTVILANYAADILYAMLDPRVRY